MAGRDQPARTQRLELAAYGADAGARGGVVLQGKRLGLLGPRGQHADMIGHIAAAPRIPFGIGERAGQSLAVGILGGEVEMQFQPRRRGLADLAETQFFLIVGGLLGIVLVVILDHAVEVQELGPAQQGLETVQDQAVIAPRLIGLAPAGADHFWRQRRILWRAFGIGRKCHLTHGFRHRLDLGPDHHRAEGLVIARRAQVVETAIQRLQKRLRPFRQGCAIAQLLADQFLDRRFVAAQAGHRALRQHRRRQPGIKPFQPRRVVQRRRHHLPRRLQTGQIGAQGVVLGRGRRRMGSRGRKPEIKRLIGIAAGKDGQRLGQAQGLAVEAGAGQRLGIGAELAAPADAVLADPFRGRAQFHRRAAAEAPEQHLNAARDLVQRHPRFGVFAGRVQPAGKGVPQLSDRFLGLPRFDLAPFRRHGRSFPSAAGAARTGPRGRSAFSRKRPRPDRAGRA